MDTQVTRKRIFVYTEAEPVDRNVVAHGLYRATQPILSSIRDHIDGIAIYPIGRKFSRNDLDQDLAALCVSLPHLPTLLCKALRRFPWVDPGIADALPPRLLAPLLRKSKAETVLCFVGADVGTLTRASTLARLSGKTCVFYVVDDFLATLRVAGMNEGLILTAAQEAASVLRAASHVFTITDGLGDLLRDSYGISSSTLHLAFEPKPRAILSPKNQIIFVGSVNFLYASGLLDLIRMVGLVRKAATVDITIRLTLDGSVARRELGHLPPFVQVAPVETSEGLAQEIAHSLFAFLPYSFDPQHKTMVSTSFPSKSMEYLAYARSIVVYGPIYGVATKLFREMGLPSIASSPLELEAMINFHLSVQPDNSALYRNYLEKVHSLAAARSTICSALGLLSG